MGVQIWQEIHGAVKAVKAKVMEGCCMSDDEATFYREDWCALARLQAAVTQQPH